MPRRPRTDLAGFPLHLIQRGNNRAACFMSDGDRSAYLQWLGRYACEYGIALHAWVLMDNHVHLLLTPPAPECASRLMQALGRRYVRYFNHRYQRSGTLWEGRFRACAVHADAYLLTCMRYIELNPVRAGMTGAPGVHRWSSYRSNALGLADSLLTEHPLYTGLGASPAGRQHAYRNLFRERLEDASLACIRTATASGHLLASQGFRKEIEAARGVRLGPAAIGRPRKRKRMAVLENDDLPMLEM